MRNVRSETLRTSTSVMFSSAATTRSAWSVPDVAQVRSMRRFSCVEGATSSAVTIPPASSTVVVSSLTAVPPEAISRRTVME